MSTTALPLLPPRASLWASRLLLTTQTVALPLTLWFRPVAIAAAVIWLFYRAYRVLHTPLDDLAALLGFDIPATPLIDLACVKADGCILHWRLPAGSEKEKERDREKERQAKAKSRLKYEVHLDGLVVESVGMLESAVTITGLPPSSYHVVRVALEFGSRSEPIRFRTRAASSGDCFVVLPDGPETDPEGAAGPVETLPHVRVYRGLRDVVAPAEGEAAPMGREHSNSGLGPKRSITGRRPSPAALGLDTKIDLQGDEMEPQYESIETIQQLTERLDALRYETDETERQAKDEEEEEVRLKEELTAERDTLRVEAAEKERATRNLKREVNILERQNTAAQNERGKQERLLQQKKMEREKLQGDVVRWEREAAELQGEAARIRKSKGEHLRQVEREKDTLRTKQAEEAAAAKTLEDEIRETNTAIKRLDRAAKNASPDPTHSHAHNHTHNHTNPHSHSHTHTQSGEEPSLVQQMQHEAEQERAWQLHRAHLQHQYTDVYQKLEAAKRFQSEQIRYLDSVRAQRRRDEEMGGGGMGALGPGQQYAQQQGQQQMGPQGQQQQMGQQMGFSSPAPSAPTPAPNTVERTMRRGDSQRSRRSITGGQAHSESSPRVVGAGIGAGGSSSAGGGFLMLPSGSSQGSPFPPGLSHVGGSAT
ncbi:hypothetical protein LTR53_013801, partial [Teratosphaeriaceae sp. CCFEE 6253]